MEVPPIIYPAGDPVLIDTIVGQLKSQGTFDQFRKECVADVDTKPAYQNLHQRVETTVAKFLEDQKWRPDMNKNQLRDSLRKHIHEMGFLETGVERIVDQVVNPKVHAVFLPQVEDVVYRVQDIPKPEKKLQSSATSAHSGSKNGGIFNSTLFSQPPPFLPGLSFLPPALQTHMQKPPPTLADLLPTDLDPVSPESSKGSMEDKGRLKESEITRQHEESLDSQLSGFSDLTSHGSEPRINSKAKGRNSSVPHIADEDSHLSKVSSNSRLSFTSSDDRSQETKKRNTVETDELEENQQSINPTIDKKSVHDNNTPYKTPPHKLEEDSVIHYEDQFSKEEEVATTVTEHASERYSEACIINEDSLDYIPLKDEKIANPIERTILDEDNSCSAKEDVHSGFCRDNESFDCKKEPNTHFQLVEVDEVSVHHSEESLCSDGSENKLQIDEMKDSSFHLEQSVQNSNEVFIKGSSYEASESKDSSCEKSPSENIVEASEEARHGFEDSQDALERPPPPPLPTTPRVSTPPAPPLAPLSKSHSPKSYVSYCGDEDDVPRTPRWEPLSINLGNTASQEDQHARASEKDENYPGHSGNNLELEEISQSGSEDMQLAWSPLSVNENKDDEESVSKNACEGSDMQNFCDSEKYELTVANVSQQDEESKNHDNIAYHENYLASNSKNKLQEDISDKNKGKARSRDDKDRERTKDEDKSYKDLSSSSKRHGEKQSSRYKDTSSRLKHEDRSRSDRERSSSHHKTDDKRKADRERSSSSKHKSSRSEERHRHREKDSKTHSSRVEDKDRERSKELKSLKSHSSERDRRERDKRDKETKDKERRTDKEREGSGRESSKHTDKKRDKEKDKEKKDKYSNACKPSQERRSPNPDSNNGSMFGGAQTTNACGSANQLNDESKDDSNKSSSPVNSDSKSCDSNQNKDVCGEFSSTSNAASASPPSSLPFKKRPLHPENSEVDESYGRLILRIKKVKFESPYHTQELKKTFKSERILQSKHEENRDVISKVEDCEASLSPLLYFENDWPTKSDDEAFCTFVNQLERNKDLSEMSDNSETKQELLLQSSDANFEAYVKNLSVSVLSESEAKDLLASQSCVNSPQSTQKKGRIKQRKRAANNQLRNKNKARQASNTNSERKGNKREAIKETKQDSLVLFKSQRERKPNKRYSNDEFTSNFGYDDEEPTQENCQEPSRTLRSPVHMDLNNMLTGVDMHHASENNASEPNALNTVEDIRKTTVTTEALSIVQASTQSQETTGNQRRGSSHSWSREEDSNSEDENDGSGYENELIGTALKNLMMESGLGGPEEASGLDKLSSPSHFTQNSSGYATKKVPSLTGVKRVGLSRNYKAKAKVNNQSTNKSNFSKSLRSEELTSENDVSASTFVKSRVAKAKKAVLGILVSDTDCNGDIQGHTAKKSERVKQHYNNDDLYKPRPQVRFTSKRRQVTAEQNDVF